MVNVLFVIFQLLANALGKCYFVVDNRQVDYLLLNYLGSPTGRGGPTFPGRKGAGHKLYLFFILAALGLCCSAWLSLAVWGCRIVWCILTGRYLVSLLPVSMIHVSDVFLVGFWSWEVGFVVWGCWGWGWRAAGTWVSVSREMVGFPAPIGWPGASQSICTQ